jgi:hypothetical protein
MYPFFHPSNFSFTHHHHPRSSSSRARSAWTQAPSQAEHENPDWALWWGPTFRPTRLCVNKAAKIAELCHRLNEINVCKIGLLTSFPTLVSTMVKSPPMLFLSYGWWIEIWETWPRIQPPSVRFSFLSSPLLSSPPSPTYSPLLASPLLFLFAFEFRSVLAVGITWQNFPRNFNKTFATKVPAFFQQRPIEEGCSNQGFRS